MIQLANGGLFGPKIGGGTSIPTGFLVGGVNTNPLQKGDIFTSLLPIPAPVNVAGEMPAIDLSPTLAEHNLPQLPTPELPLELPGGKHLPVAAETPVASTELNLPQPPEAAIIPPLAREDVVLKKPAIDRLTATSLNAPLKDAAPPAPVPQSVTPSADTNRQISSLAIAAAQVLTASRQATRAEPQAEPKAPSSVKAPAPFGSVPEPSAKPVSQPAIVLTAPGLTPISEPDEPPLDTKPIAARAVAEPTTQQPVSSTPTPATQAPVASADPGTTQQPAMEAKPTASNATRADQQATFDRLSDQMMLAREVAQAGTTQIRLPHEQFGAIRMQLELAGAGLKVTLGNNDPGFAQSVQLALAERVSAVADTPRAESNNARQDGAAQNSGQQTSMSQSGGFTSQNHHQASDQHERDKLTFGEALFNEQRAAVEHEPDDTGPSPSGLFA